MNGQFYFHQGLDQAAVNAHLDQQPPPISPFHLPVQQLPPPPPPPPTAAGHHHLAAHYAGMTCMPAPIPRARGQRRGLRRNPEAPKRPMSPYVTFVKEKWKSVRDSLPGAAAKDVMRNLGEQWNVLPEAEKEKWKQLSDEDKARYATEMQSFDGPSTIAVARRSGADGGRRRRARKDPNAPKRGASAFLLFANEKCVRLTLACTPHSALGEKRSRTPIPLCTTLKFHACSVRRCLPVDLRRCVPTGAIWKAADEATKAPYVEAEAEARRQYGKAMEEYRSQNGLLQLQHHSGPVDYAKQELGDDEHHDVEPHLEPHEHHLSDGDIYVPMAGAPGPGFVPPPLGHPR